MYNGSDLFLQVIPFFLLHVPSIVWMLLTEFDHVFTFGPKNSTTHILHVGKKEVYE